MLIAALTYNTWYLAIMVQMIYIWEHTRRVVALWYSWLIVVHLAHYGRGRMAAFFCSQHFKIHFRVFKWLYLTHSLLAFVPKGQINNKSALVPIRLLSKCGEVIENTNIFHALSLKYNSFTGVIPLNNPPLLPHVCVGELGPHWFR